MAALTAVVAGNRTLMSFLHPFVGALTRHMAARTAVVAGNVSPLPITTAPFLPFVRALTRHMAALTAVIARNVGPLTSLASRPSFFGTFTGEVAGFVAVVADIRLIPVVFSFFGAIAGDVAGFTAFVTVLTTCHPLWGPTVLLRVVVVVDIRVITCVAAGLEDGAVNLGNELCAEHFGKEIVVESGSETSKMHRLQ